MAECMVNAQTNRRVFAVRRMPARLMRGANPHIVVVALAVLWNSTGTIAQQAAPISLGAAQAAAAASWPHTITINGASVTVYEPQAISWAERKSLTARAAVGILRPGQTNPFLGTIELTVATRVDDANGVVYLSNMTLLSTHFPALDTAQAAALETKIRAGLLETQARPVPLNSILLSLKQLPVTNVSVNNNPPVIFYSDRAASLIVFDGEPVLTIAGKSGMTYAVNTNWDVFLDNRTWYLLNNGSWFSASQANGPYSPVASLPDAFNAFKGDASFARVSRYIPAKAMDPKEAVPKIFVSMKPAEIIVTGGAPDLTNVAGTGLKRVMNTSSLLFFYPANGLYYLQISGRWFSTHRLEGPWEFATDKLPADFSLIPPDGPDAAVLALVPGTIAAQEALVKAQIPTTATIERSAAKLTVIYSGAPHFVPVTGTTMSYAVNTNAYVLQIGNGYYACDSGAWFISATPSGPWLLADSVPPVIYTIPPSSPMYHVTYVRVYAATPAYVTYGFTSGYMLGYVSYGVLVYGTGFYYPPVVIAGPVPIFYPYPYTYAGAVWYNPSNGAWARGGTVYGPYGGAVSAGRYYNPTTGTYARGAAVYGPNGGAGAWSAYNPSTGGYAYGSASWSNGSGSANASYYNPRTGVSGSTSQNVNPYGRSGSSTFSGPNGTVNTQSGANANGRAGGFNSSTGAKGAGYQNNITGGSGGAVKTKNGDVYAGHDGNVYQKTDNGWSKYDNGSWNPVQPPSNNTNRTAPANKTLPTTAPNSPGGSGGMDRSGYQQLDQDRLGRQAGSGRFGGVGGTQNAGRNRGGGGRTRP
jgi:hypothetical protein